MEGYLWFYKKIYSGSKEDYLIFLKKYPKARFVMTLRTGSLKSLSQTADNLNRSNVLTKIQAEV